MASAGLDGMNALPAGKDPNQEKSKMGIEIPPLRKQGQDGALYVRPQEIEDVIVETYKISFEKLIARAMQLDRNSPDYLPSEVLLHRIRATRYRTSDDQFDALYSVLNERVSRSCPNVGTRADGRIGEAGKLMDVREYVLDRFTTLILKDRDAYEERLDIFEIRFDRAVMLMRKDAFRTVSRRENPLTPLDYDESGDLSEDVEESLSLLDPRSMTLGEEITYRFQVRRAIDSLPDMERRVIDMLEAEIPIESNSPDEPSIAGLLGCTPKTVRNRRDRAVRRVREALRVEVCDAN